MSIIKNNFFILFSITFLSCSSQKNIENHILLGKFSDKNNKIELTFNNDSSFVLKDNLQRIYYQGKWEKINDENIRLTCLPPENLISYTTIYELKKDTIIKVRLKKEDKIIFDKYVLKKHQ